MYPLLNMKDEDGESLPTAVHLSSQMHSDMQACWVQDLRAANVVHFDIKAENILLEPLPGCSEQEFWRPSSDRLPFKVILADFGESRMFASMDDDRTVRCRSY